MTIALSPFSSWRDPLLSCGGSLKKTDEGIAPFSLPLKGGELTCVLLTTEATEGVLAQGRGDHCGRSGKCEREGMCGWSLVPVYSLPPPERVRLQTFQPVLYEIVRYHHRH